MRILLCLNNDLMSNWALNLLAPALRGHTFDIMLSERVGKVGAIKAPEIEAWQQVESQLLEKIGQSQSGLLQSFAQCAAHTESGRIHRFLSINEGDGLAYVQDFNPDLILSIRFGQILKAPVIAVPTHGVLNLHSGILPDYRGVLATFWALLHEEKEVGCTLHYISDGTIDTGAIINIHRINADPARSLAWHISKLYEGGTQMIAAVLDVLSRGESLKTQPQTRDAGSYYTYPTQLDVQRFLKTWRLFEDADYRALLATEALPA